MVRISVAILLMSASFADARTVSDPWLTGAATGTPTPSATSSSAPNTNPQQGRPEPAQQEPST